MGRSAAAKAREESKSCIDKMKNETDLLNLRKEMWEFVKEKYNRETVEDVGMWRQCKVDGKYEDCTSKSQANGVHKRFVSIQYPSGFSHGIPTYARDENFDTTPTRLFGKDDEYDNQWLW
jgi:hypothetical protein